MLFARVVAFNKSGRPLWAIRMPRSLRIAFSRVGRSRVSARRVTNQVGMRLDPMRALSRPIRLGRRDTHLQTACINGLPWHGSRQSARSPNAPIRRLQRNLRCDRADQQTGRSTSTSASPSLTNLSARHLPQTARIILEGRLVTALVGSSEPATKRMANLNCKARRYGQEPWLFPVRAGLKRR